MKPSARIIRNRKACIRRWRRLGMGARNRAGLYWGTAGLTLFNEIAHR